MIAVDVRQWDRWDSYYVRTSSVLWLNSPMPGKTVATVGSVFREGIQTSIEPRTTDIGKACAKFFSLCESWHPIFESL